MKPYTQRPKNLIRMQDHQLMTASDQIRMLRRSAEIREKKERLIHVILAIFLFMLFLIGVLYV